MGIIMLNKSFAILIIFFSVSLLGSAQTLEKKDTSEVRFLNSRKFYIYKVEKGETLFSISQKFHIPQEEILEFNSDLKANGLKAKMKLWIPAYSWLKKESAEGEKQKDKPAESKKIQIAVITALNLPKQYLENDPADSSYVEEPLDKDLVQNIEFVEGVRYAFEEAQKNGYKVELTIIDDESDTLKIGRALRPEANFTAIITNETGQYLKYISRISQNRNIRLFSTGINTTETVKNNMHAVCLLPSSLTQCKMAGYFAGQFFPNTTGLFIRTSNLKENERSAAYREGWLKNQRPIIQCDYGKNKTEGVVDSLSMKKETVIFVPSSNEDMVTSLLSSLKEKKDTGFKFQVIGLPTWLSFETVDPRMMETANVYLFTSAQVNYLSAEVAAFRKYFREKFNTEPGESGMQGHDAAMIVMHAVNENGKDLSGKDLTPYKGLYTDYNFSSAEDGPALENKVIHVFRSGNEDQEDLSKKIQWK